MSLADYQALTEDLVRDPDGVLSAEELDAAIARAVDRYSEDKPRVVVEDVSAGGGYLVDLPSGWVAGFSQVFAIEHPVGQMPPNTLNGWGWYRSPAGLQLQLPVSVTAGADVRITFSAKHTLDESTDTLPGHHLNPVSALAASYLCEQLASHYANDSDSSISADAVDHKTKSERWAMRARRFRSEYLSGVGASEKRATPASAVKDLDLGDSRGRDRIFHPARHR